MIEYNVLLCYSLYFLLHFFDSKVPLIVSLAGELITAFLNISEMLNEQKHEPENQEKRFFKVIFS